MYRNTLQNDSEHIIHTPAYLDFQAGLKIKYKIKIIATYKNTNMLNEHYNIISQLVKDKYQYPCNKYDFIFLINQTEKQYLIEYYTKQILQAEAETWD